MLTTLAARSPIRCHERQARLHFLPASNAELRSAILVLKEVLLAIKPTYIYPRLPIIILRYAYEMGDDIASHYTTQVP